jgi:hypothetical protein
MLTLKKNKKLLLIILFIIVYFIAIPVLEIILRILFDFGRYIGMNARFIEEGICLK